jgi:hypothetical protein
MSSLAFAHVFFGALILAGISVYHIPTLMQNHGSMAI